tara:strand:+ start:54 stop:302 length:249 start_codon:yes stop_codon:yes gene_type:complete
MNYEDLKSRPIKQNGERSNHDFHLRLSKTEKERLVMLTKSANYATMSQFLKDQLFRPDLHFKLDLILKFLKDLAEEKNGKEE